MRMNTMRRPMAPSPGRSLPHKDAITSLAFHPSPSLLSLRKSKQHNLSQLASGTIDGGITIWNFKNNQKQERRGGGGDDDGGGDGGGDHSISKEHNEINHHHHHVHMNKKKNQNQNQNHHHNNYYNNDDVRAYKFCGHTGAVHDIAYSPSGSLLASASSDKTVRLWVPKAHGDSVVLRGHSAPVRGVDFSPHRACSTSANMCTCTNASPGDGLGNGGDGAGAGADQSFLSCESLLMTCSDDKLVKLWTLPSKSFQSSLKGHTNWVRTCKFSPDVAHIAASGGDDGTIRVWDIVRGMNAVTYHVNPYHHHHHLHYTATAARPTRSSNRVADGVTSVSFHPSGSLLAASIADGWVKLYDLRTDELIHAYPPSGERVAYAGGYRGGKLSFRLDGNQFMTSITAPCTSSTYGCSQNTMEDSDHGAGQQQQQQQQYQSQQSVFYLWDIRTHQTIYSVSHHHKKGVHDGSSSGGSPCGSISSSNNGGHLPSCCAFANDGKMFATGGGCDREVKVWDVPTFDQESLRRNSNNNYHQREEHDDECCRDRLICSPSHKLNQSWRQKKASKLRMERGGLAVGGGAMSMTKHSNTTTTRTHLSSNLQSHSNDVENSQRRMSNNHIPEKHEDEEEEEEEGSYEIEGDQKISALMEGTLDHIIGQIELLTKTMALIEKRLSIQEESIQAISSGLLPKKNADDT